MNANGTALPQRSGRRSNPHLLVHHLRCAGRLNCDLASLRLPEFRDGVIVGAAIVVVGLAGATLRGQGRSWLTAAGSGAAAAAGFVLTLALTGHFLVGFGLAVALLAAGGAAAHRRSGPASSRLVVTFAALIPGALLIALGAGLTNPLGTRLVAALVVATAGPLLADLDRRSRRAVAAPVLLALALAGMYECVPDSGILLPLLGLLAATVVLGCVVSVPLGPSGAAAIVGCAVWAGTIGGVGRPPTVLAAWGCLGLIVVEPLVRMATGFSPLEASEANADLLVLFGQLGVVYTASRVASFRHGAIGVGSVLLADLVAGAGLLLASRRWWAPLPPLPPRGDPGNDAR
jgi:hypothetical protein